MARRKKQEVEPPVGPREFLPGGPAELAKKVVDATLEKWAREDAGTRVPDVREVAAARTLLTIGPEHPCWPVAGPIKTRLTFIGGEDVGAEGVVSMVRLDFTDGAGNGGIVRVQPPEGATDEQVEHVRASLVEAGAAVVRVQPRRKSRVLTAPVARTTHAGVRAVIDDLLRESNVEDRDSLAAFVGGVMARQGL